MLDFASALYLGLRHESGALPPWDAFTTGVPAAFAEPPAAAAVAWAVARLQGCDRATLAPSTLHAFWDLGGAFAAGYEVVVMDEGAYATVRWGVERMAARGLTVRPFRHHDPDALRRRLRDARGRPLVVADGFCPRCGSSAPVAEYLAVTRERGGILVLDDTQALGILGHSPALHPPYGTGGGGSLPWSGCRSAGVMLVSSMAKAFGVPLAIVAGAADAVRRFERSSDTRVHCSPPAVPTLHAAGRALAINRQCGNALRQRLAANVFRFRARLAAAGFDAVGGAFPVQTLRLRSDVDAGRIHDDLQRAAVRSVLRRGGRTGGPLLTFIVTARHSTSDLDQAVDRLSSVVKPAARQLEVVGHDA